MPPGRLWRRIVTATRSIRNRPPNPGITVAIHDPLNQLQYLRPALAAHGVAVIDGSAAASALKAVWLSSVLDDMTKARLSQGGSVVLLAGSRDALPPRRHINDSAPRRIRPDRRLGQQLQLGSIVEPAIQASFSGDRRLDSGLGGGLHHAGVRDRRIEARGFSKCAGRCLLWLDQLQSRLPHGTK